jgi:hypothetical protein
MIFVYPYWQCTQFAKDVQGVRTNAEILSNRGLLIKKPVHMIRNRFAIARSDIQVRTLWEPHKGVISHKGTMLQSQTGEDLEANLATPWIGG